MNMHVRQSRVLLTAVVVLGLTGGALRARTVEPAATRDRVFAQWTWHNADVRSVFEELSTISGIDFVLSDAVSGRVSLAVTNKTWRDVCDIVCKIRKLALVKHPNYIYVQTMEEYSRERLESVTNHHAVEQLSPLAREVLRLSNTTAAEMRPSVEPLLSPRGKVTVVQHTNALIIFDTQDNIEQIKAMVAQLDVETEQISIAAKIIEVSSGELQNLGIQWGFFGRAGGASVGAEHLPGNPVVAGALQRLTYGILSQDRLAMTLEYLFNDNKADVVAQPSITTIDNKEARIFMGNQLQVLVRDEGGNVFPKYIQAGTELIVTPHVTDKNRIMLSLNARKESPSGGGNIQSQNAQTTVVVNNGETVVIAGLTSNEVNRSEEGVPVLKSIPLIGNLFKRSSKSVNKKDLIIFVTPHIIQKDLESVRVEDGQQLSR